MQPWLTPLILFKNLTQRRGRRGVAYLSPQGREREYIGTVKLAVYENVNRAHLCYFSVAFSHRVRKICVNFSGE